MTYDNNNVFAKILRGEIPCDKVYEDDHVLAVNDINPQAPIHVLVIPKGPYVDMDDFTANAPAELIAALFRAVGQVARQLDLGPEQGGSGYRILANAGTNAHQDVPHLHVHLFGGRRLGPMLTRKND